VNPNKTTLYCKQGPINWECVCELASRLGNEGFEATSVTAELGKYPVRVVFGDLQSAAAYVREKGEPFSYDIHLFDDKHREFYIGKFMNVHKERVLSLRAEGFGDERILRSIAAFLGLEPDSETDRKESPRTAFIAHRFDAHGSELADKLARFLSLLQFEVKTGRAFAAKSVADKVKERLSSQQLVFVILTPGEDSTWLVQESVLQHGDKPLFVLREHNATFTPGMLADYEYIPFAATSFESCYQQILEGLGELNYLRFNE
jgi:hypothetical protein